MTLWLALLLMFTPVAQTANTPLRAVSGPAHGSLVLVGGGRTQPDIMRRFIQLAGGPAARIVVIESALPDERLTPAGLASLQSRASELFGVPVTVLHTRDRTQADSEDFVKPLKSATAVWTFGGDENRLSVYVGTRTEREIKAVAERGGVLGGTSAGALVLAQFTTNVTADTPEQWAHPLTGFNLLTNTIVIPHWSQRGGQLIIPETMKPHPGMIAIAVDEATAALITGTRLEVVGDGKVGIYDGSMHDGLPYRTVAVGETLDLGTLKNK
jgi:cyanophycinase